MISKGRRSLEELKISDADILSKYLGITQIPCVIQSPLRSDNRPSFGLYSPDGTHINYIDFGTKDKGTTLTLLSKMWNTDTYNTIKKINDEIGLISNSRGIITLNKSNNRVVVKKSVNTDLKCKIREWKDYDIKYWESYGINLKWLKLAEVYPISHKIIVKDNHSYVFKADKYAYAYVEHKEGKIFIKVYQPFNRKYKWCSNTNRSVWSLWTKIPKFGANLIISSSVKDCLNIMCNLKIPSICLQGEGYLPKPHIMEELKLRYKNIIVFFDNDFTNPNNPGHNDAKNLSEEYNLKMVEIPKEYESKDPSDLFKKYGKEKYLEIMNEIFKDVLWKSGEV